MSDLCNRCGARDSDLHTFWLCPENRHIDDKNVTSTNKLIQTAVLGSELLPCLWLRGLLPSPLSAVPDEYQPPSDLSLIYKQYTVNSNNNVVGSGTYYGDASGGKFSSYPSLRRCGVGLVHTTINSANQIVREWGCSIKLIGPVQTVPRAELFALHFLLNEAAPLSVIEFITDNFKNCENFNKGEIQKGHFKNNKRNGIWEYFDNNGVLEKKIHYEDGQQGLYEGFDKQGRLIKTGNHNVWGDKHGLWETFHENGQTEREEHYTNGKRNGLWKKFHENSELETRGKYNNDKQEGIWEYFDNNGVLEKKIHYEDGQLFSKQNYKNGKEVSNTKFYYHDNGQLSSRGNYKNGKRDGLTENFRENGQLGSRKNYKNGKEDGLFEFYHENGQPSTTVNYKNGKQHGISETYREDGELWVRENYKDGKLDGLWESFIKGDPQRVYRSICYKNYESVNMSYCED